MLNFISHRGNANQSHSETQLVLSGMATIRQSYNNKCKQNMEKTESSYSACGNIKWCSHFGKQPTVLPHVNVELPFDGEMPPLRIYHRELKTCAHTKAGTGMFIAGLLTISKRWKLPVYPSTDEWTNKTCAYNGILLDHKWNKVLTHGTTCITFKMLCYVKEVIRRPHMIWFYLYEISGIG